MQFRLGPTARALRAPPAGGRRHQALLQGRGDPGGRQQVALRRGAGGGGRHRVPGDRGGALRRPARVPAAAGREIPLQIADLDVGVLYIFAIRRSACTAIVMAGWAANNKYTLLGGLRSSAQMFSYELALGLSWVGVIMLAGSFRIARHRDARRRAGLLALELLRAVPGLPRLPGRGHRRGEPHAVRPAGGARPSSWPASTPSTRRCASRSCRWPST